MQTLSLQEIDEVRNQGFRPQAVGCLLNDKKILFVYKKEYDLWQLPQGGIDNKETIEKALIREMSEELGEKLIKQCDKKTITVVGEDKIEFPPETQGSRELKNDAGDDIFMRGKKYFLAAIQSKTQNIDIKDTEFEDYRWLAYNEAVDLADTIYQRGKRRITISALDSLKEAKLL